MKSISHFIIAIVELAEAEGRDLRASVRTEAHRLRAALVTLTIALAILLVSVPLFAAGAFLLIAGFMWWLESQVSKPLAAVLAGMAFLLLGGSCVLLSRSLAKARVE